MQTNKMAPIAENSESVVTKGSSQMQEIKLGVSPSVAGSLQIDRSDSVISQGSVSVSSLLSTKALEDIGSPGKARPVDGKAPANLDPPPV